MTTYSQSPYIGDGTTTTFALTFPYVQQGDVTVTVNSLPAPFTFRDSTHVTLAAAPAPGTLVVVQRHTTVASSVVTYQDGSVLGKTDLNSSVQQLLFSVQELTDGASNLDESALQVQAPEVAIQPLPLVASRANRLLGFDSSGNPVALPASPVTVSQDSQFISYLPPVAGAVATSVQNFLKYTVRPQNFILPGDAGNDALSIQRALNAAAILGVPVYLGGQTYNLASGVQVDVNRTSLIGSGAVLNCASFTNQIALSVFTSMTDPNEAAVQHAAHPFSGFVIIGPVASSGSTSTGIALFPTTVGGAPWIHNVTFRDGGVFGFATGCSFGSGAFDNLFDRWNFGANVVAFIGNAGALNANERNTFSGCQIFGTTSTAVSLNGGGDWYFLSCSFDGGATALSIAGAMVKTFGCHFEVNPTSSQYLVTVSGDNSRLIDFGSVFEVDSLRTVPLMNCASTVTGGGIILHGSHLLFALGSYPNGVLIDGTGPAQAIGVTQEIIDDRTALSASANLLRDGKFSNGGFIHDWTFSGTAGFAPALDPTHPLLDGSSPIHFTNSTTSGFVNYATGAYPCRPGQQAVMTAQFLAVVAASGTSFSIQVSYLDIAGNSLGASANTITADQPAFKLITDAANPAPPGTAFAKFSMFMSPSTSGVANAWVGDINAFVY